MLDHDFLTFQAADPGAAAAHRNLFDFFRRTINFMELKRRALLGLARIAPSHPRRVGHHSAELLVDFLRRIGKKHRVAVAFAHRSEERRVGKECGSWWSSYDYG